MSARGKEVRQIEKDSYKANAIKREDEFLKEKQKLLKETEESKAKLLRKHEQQLAQKDAMLASMKREKVFDFSYQLSPSTSNGFCC